jgi:chromosome segregation ATPase
MGNEGNNKNIIPFPQREKVEKEKSHIDELAEEIEYLREKIKEIGAKKRFLEEKRSEAKLQNRSGVTDIEFSIEEQVNTFNDIEKRLTALEMEASKIMRDKEDTSLEAVIPMDAFKKKMSEIFRTEIANLLAILDKTKESEVWSKEDLGELKAEIIKRIERLKSWGEKVFSDSDDESRAIAKAILGIAEEVTAPAPQRIDSITGNIPNIPESNESDEITQAKKKLGELTQERLNRINRLLSGTSSADEVKKIGEELAEINKKIEVLEGFLKSRNIPFGPDQ